LTLIGWHADRFGKNRVGACSGSRINKKINVFGLLSRHHPPRPPGRNRLQWHTYGSMSLMPTQ
jgi:hypothetical protein